MKPSVVYPRILSADEKKAVLTLDNLDNLSLSARYYVISNVVKKLKKQLENVPKDKLHKKDEYGRTLLETIEIYKELCDSLHVKIAGIKEAVISDDDNTNDLKT